MATWRLEATGAKSVNEITIEPVRSPDGSGYAHVRIQVRALNGEHPTMPLYPSGTIYRDRNGVDYTILGAVVAEVGPDDGETSFWRHEYLARIGAHTLSGLHS
jgi:hypothetical protein